MGWLDLSLVVASLAAAGALAGVVGGALRLGGGVVLLPALLGMLPMGQAAGVMPALAVALGANLILSGVAAWPKPEPVPRYWRGAAAAGGGLAAGFCVAFGAGVPVALALVLAAVALIAPLPRRRVQGGAGVGLAALAGGLSAMAGGGGGAFGGPLLRLAGVTAPRAAAVLGVSLGAPALAVLALAAAGGAFDPLSLLGAIPVAGAAWLTAPFGSRMAAQAPGLVLRGAVAFVVLGGGFSLLSAVLRG
jgi:hypothetical protein